MASLHAAVQQGRIEDVRSCLDRGDDIDAPNDLGRSPLDLACRVGQIQAALLLLDRGADVDRLNRGGASPLTIACQECHIDAAKLCLDRGAQVDGTAESRAATPLYWVCYNGYAEAATLLLDRGADIERGPENAARVGGHPTMAAWHVLGALSFGAALRAGGAAGARRGRPGAAARCNATSAQRRVPTDARPDALRLHDGRGRREGDCADRAVVARRVRRVAR